MWLQSISENLGDTLDSGVLEGNWAEVLRLPRVILFRKKHQVRSVEPLQVSRMGVEGAKEQEQVRGGGSPHNLGE